MIIMLKLQIYNCRSWVTVLDAIDLGHQTGHSGQVLLVSAATYRSAVQLCHGDGCFQVTHYSFTNGLVETYTIEHA